MSDAEMQKILSQLYDAYQPAMLRRAYHRTGSVSDAEDIVSNCWVSLISHAQRLLMLDDKARSTYIMRSLDNKITDFLRTSARKKQQPPCDHMMSLEGLDAFTHQHDTCEDRILHLTKRQREIVHLRCAGLRFTKIATLLDLSPSTVRVYWMRAVKRLRTMQTGE
ncbi:MAG: sigma-70 family RNA polymerase sigma factor [Christensenellaceae bacterium]|nr:sigma-70 family RNA polymerase sigma factor [Christensenellaceae bacterium]